MKHPASRLNFGVTCRCTEHLPFLSTLGKQRKNKPSTLHSLYPHSLFLGGSRVRTEKWTTRSGHYARTAAAPSPGSPLAPSPPCRRGDPRPPLPGVGGRGRPDACGPGLTGCRRPASPARTPAPGHTTLFAGAQTSASTIRPRVRGGAEDARPLTRARLWRRRK